MSAMSLIISEDDPEEGEIVDDDFEDISDNSIIEPFNIGKFVSPKEHLPAISLSSVSDSDVPEREDTNKFKLRHRHRPSRKKCKSFRRKKCSHNHRRHSSDSDSDEYLDRKLQKQLKAAIHVDTEECHKNSLRTRLRAMTKSDENDIEQLSGKSDNENEVEQPKECSNEPEEDLIQLRLEALRTAVLNKFEHRKKRKLRETPQNRDDFEVTEVVDTSEINKENTQLVNDSEPPNKKICERKPHENEEDIETTPPEEDEDVLRALLLASMSKKITKEVVPTKTVLNTQIPKERVVPKHTAFFMKKVLPIKVHKKGMVPLKNHAINKNNFKSHMKTAPKINPIIINVDDTDTDDDSPNNTIKNVEKAEVIPKASEIESSVEKFLKEQRAKVEAQSSSANQIVTDTNELLILNKLSSSCKTKSRKPTEFSKQTLSCKSSEPCRPIEPHNSTDIMNTPNTPTSTSVILEKSSVKLLPKIKQIEYQKLLQKLKNAEKKPPMRHLSPTVNSETQVGSNTSKKLVRNKISVSVKHNVKKIEQNPDIKSDARTLHMALKEMQRQKGGRLQIEEKYVVLTPIIKKINETSTERKKYDQEVKRLLQELADAKKKLRETHIRFSAHVKELIKQKQHIESRCKTLKLNGGQLKEVEPKIKEVTAKNRKQKDVAFTSTPKKDHPPLESFEASTIPPMTPNDTPNNTLSEVLSNSVRDKSKDDEKKTEEVTSNDVIVIIEKPNKGKDIFGNNPDVIDVPINPGDPNDIDRIYKTHNVVPEYRSPLECVKRKDWYDPLAIMCPYDVDGNCRDAECIYKHYSK